MILTRKLIVPALLVFALLLAGLFGYFISMLHTAYHNTEEADLRSFSDSFFAEMENQKRLAMVLSLQAAGNPIVQEALLTRDTDPLSKQAELVEQMAGVANVSYYGLFLPNGSLIFSRDIRQSGDSSAVHAEPGPWLATAEEGPSAGLALIAGRLGVVGVAPVVVEGRHAGFVMLSTGLNETLLTELKEKYGGEWQILISEQRVVESELTAVESPVPGFMIFATTQDTPLFNDPAGYENALSGESTITHPSANGRDFAILSTPVRDYSNRIIGVLDIVYDHTHISGIQNNQLLLAGLVTLAALLLGSLGLILLTRRTLSPIQQLTSAISDVAEGNIMRNINIAPGNDEVGILVNAFNRMTLQLRNSIAQLEQHVADRTQDLENQTLRLRTAAEIARDTASARDLNQLLEVSAELILERFQLDHVGVFLLDKDGEFAVLAASPTAAGRAMLAENHKLRVGEPGIVEQVAATGEPSFELDSTGQNNPLFPATRSQMAVPLRVEARTIGVLDLHSDQSNAFRHEDIAIMQVLADQLATSIERARLLEAVERNLSELERAYGEYTRAGWQRVAASRQLRNRGYRFDNIRVEPVTQVPALAKAAIQAGSPVTATGGANSDNVAIPIKFRGETIGIISAKLREGFGRSTLHTLQSAAERLASALESARLYEEERLRADREQSISHVISSISSSTEYEEILRTTVMEIGSVLVDTEVSIRIGDSLGDTPAGGIGPQ